MPVSGGPAGSRGPLPALVAFAVVGALVASRQPRNSVGWLLLAVAVCMTVRLVGESYAIRQLREQIATAAPTSGRVLIKAGWRGVYGEEIAPQGKQDDDSGGDLSLPWSPRR